MKTRMYLRPCQVTFAIASCTCRTVQSRFLFSSLKDILFAVTIVFILVVYIVIIILYFNFLQFGSQSKDLFLILKSILLIFYTEVLYIHFRLSGTVCVALWDRVNPSLTVYRLQTVLETGQRIGALPRPFDAKIATSSTERVAFKRSTTVELHSKYGYPFNAPSSVLVI